MSWTLLSSLVFLPSPLIRDTEAIILQDSGCFL
jgi:hypothetical protein